MRHRLWIIGLALMALLGTCRTLEAQAISANATQLYYLTEESTYGEGCLPPCACPWFPSVAIDGTFELTRTATTPLGMEYKVSNVNWLVTNYDGSTLTVTGSGEYSINTWSLLPTHRMRLKLSFDGGAAQLFDSGTMQWDNNFPRIDIDMAVNDFFCYDQVIGVRALPVNHSDLRRYTLTDSAYQFGCLPPCLCPISITGLNGTFGLVRLTERDGVTTYGVVRIAWTIGGPATTPADAEPMRVRGRGIYRTQADEHRIWLHATVGDTPEDEFDSGWMTRENDTSTIDIAAADNDFYCFNRVFLIHAVTPTLSAGR